MYLAVKNKWISLLSKFLFVALLIVGLVWADVRWLQPNISSNINAVIILLFCLVIAWLYRLSWKWLFNADAGQVKIIVKYNMLAYVWVDICIDDQVIFSVKNWKPKSIDIERIVKYKGKELLVKLHIVKSEDGHNSPACSMSIDNVKLAPPP